MNTTDERDTFVYDDDCGFCTWWAKFAIERTNMRVLGFSDLSDPERERLPDNWEDCAHLLTDDRVFSCGAAIEELLVRTDVALPGSDDFVDFLRQFQDYERLRERLYREAADRRDVWGVFVSEDEHVKRE